MKRSLILMLFVLVLASCHTTKHASSAGNNNTSHSYKKNTPDRDGSSYEKAVIIEETSEMTGVSAEYTWLAKHYPGYQSLGQALLSKDKIPYDRIKIKTSTGEEKDVYFDISNYFGKF